MIRARLEVSLSALRENARAVRGALTPGAALCAVVKADAYGHGLCEAAAAFAEGGADCVGVARAEEGAQLREAGFSGVIVVLGTEEDAALIARYRLEAAVAGVARAADLAREADKRGVSVGVHIKADTGMNRLGVRTPEQAAALAGAVAGHPRLRLSAVFSHLAAADARDGGKLNEQLRRFDGVAAAMPHGTKRHIANSAAVLRDARSHGNMVRPGLLLYGCAPAPGLSMPPGVKTAMTWRVPIERVADVSAGEGVGYGPHFVAPRAMRVATLGVGYGDGYHRVVNRGCVLIGGKRAPILGAVCMDHMMADITGIGAEAGEEAVLLGAQGGEIITPDDLAAAAGTLSYEIMLARLPRMPRIFLR